MESAAGEAGTLAGRAPTTPTPGGADCADCKDRGAGARSRGSDTSMEGEGGSAQCFCIASDSDCEQVSPRGSFQAFAETPGKDGDAAAARGGTGGGRPVLSLRLNCPQEEELSAKEQPMRPMRSPRPHSDSMLEGVVSVGRRFDARRHSAPQGVRREAGDTLAQRTGEGGDDPTTLNICADLVRGFPATSVGESSPLGGRAGHETGLTDEANPKSSVSTPPVQSMADTSDETDSDIQTVPSTADCLAGAAGGAVLCAAFRECLPVIPPWPDKSTDCLAGVDAVATVGAAGMPLEKKLPAGSLPRPPEQGQCHEIGLKLVALLASSLPRPPETGKQRRRRGGDALTKDIRELLGELDEQTSLMVLSQIAIRAPQWLPKVTEALGRGF